MQANPLDSMPNAQTSPQAWVTWYGTLKDYFGRKVADQVWVRTWDIYGGVDSPANTADLRDGMAKNDITIDASGSSQAYDTIRHTVTGVTDFFGDFMQMGKFAVGGILVIGLGGAALLIYGLTKNPNKTIETGTKVAKMAI
jgi:hypothetical protein